MDFAGTGNFHIEMIAYIDRYIPGAGDLHPCPVGNEIDGVDVACAAYSNVVKFRFPGEFEFAGTRDIGQEFSRFDLQRALGGAAVDDPLYAGAEGALALAEDMPEEYWEDM